MEYKQSTTNSRKNKHLSLTERVKGELKRGTVDQIKVGKVIKIYLADAGQARYEENRKSCGSKYLILECDDFVKHVEAAMIKNTWSVDSSVGKARALGAFTKTLCIRTIYNYIDLGLMEIKNIDLPLKLRRKPKISRIRKNKKILGASIEDRPEHIDNREEFGHWEIDTVIGSKFKEDEALLTLLERKTRNALIRKISGKNADAVMAEMEQIQKEFGNKFSNVFKTITSDNGSEVIVLKPSCGWRNG